MGISPNLLHFTLFLSFPLLVFCFLPAQNPQWPPTYNMSMSTAITGMNYSGFIDPKLAGQWGLVFYDWSNAKQMWCNQSPMDCQERLVYQAAITKAQNPNTKVFVYRNLVKALPWYTSVRVKLDDPQYSGFFLKFKPGGAFPNGSYHVPACTYEKCSQFYHDQEQTPQVPTPKDPNPDGVCYKECDCGLNPCGEYLFDHRNGSMLTNYLLKEHIFGQAGLDNPNIDGFFIDDFWCSNVINKTCNDPVQGPTEIDANSQADMGLSDEDIRQLTIGWLDNMETVQRVIVARKKFTWSLFPNQQNANLMPMMVNQTTCLEVHRTYCGTPYWQNLPLILGLAPSVNNTRKFDSLTQTMAMFLLMRGPYAYLTYGNWGLGWPWDLSRPKEFDTDYGVPLDMTCREVSDGVFAREWSKASVSLDCKNWIGEIKMK